MIHRGPQSHGDRLAAASDILAELRAFGFLSGLPSADLASFAACASFVRLPVDCLVYEQYAEGNSMYLLLSGRVRFWVDDSDLRGMTLGYAAAPDVFGELCFLSPGLRSTNVTTCSEVELLQLDSRDVVRLASACPDLIPVLTREVVERCRGNVETLQNTVFRTAKERVINTLMAIAAESAKASVVDSRRRRLGVDADSFVVQGYTHEDLASMAFTTRETVTRTLAELEQEGVIEARATAWLRIRPSMIRKHLQVGSAYISRPSSRSGPTSRAVI